MRKNSAYVAGKYMDDRPMMMAVDAIDWHTVTLQHAATRCNKLQHAATHRIALQRTVIRCITQQ